MKSPDSAFGWLLCVPICVLIMLTMSACTDSDGLSVLSEDDATLCAASVQVDITLSNSPSTRADDAATTVLNLDVVPTEPATAVENDVKVVHLYLFAEGAPHADNPIDIPVLKSTASFLTSTVSYQSAVVKVKGQTAYHAYLLVNPPTTYEGKTESEFSDATASFSAVGTTDDMASQGIPMSARTNTAPYTYLEVTPTAVNAQIYPVRLSFVVERSWAKVSYADTSTDYPLYLSTDEAIDTAPIGSVSLLGYRFLNIPAAYYLFRHVGLLETPNALQSSFGAYSLAQTVDAEGTLSETNVYVCDPYSARKAFTTSGATVTLTCPTAAYLADYAVGSALAYTPLTAATSAANTLLGYIPENVMACANQKKGYATGLVFKARITPGTVYGSVKVTVTQEGETEQGESGTTTETQIQALTGSALDAYLKSLQAGTATLYFYQPSARFYSSMAALLQDNRLTDDISPAIQKSTERRNRFGIYCYSGGLCYYPYYLRLYTPETRIGGHFMQAMEFAIVRNNEYRLAITRIALRAAEGLSIDPTEDVLLNDVYLTATVDVAPWMLRTGAMTFGGF